MARVSAIPPVCEIFPVLAQVERNAKRKAQSESGGQRQPLLQPYILVMPQGGRDLAVVALKERLKLSDIHGIMGQSASARLSSLERPRAR